MRIFFRLTPSLGGVDMQNLVSLTSLETKEVLSHRRTPILPVPKMPIVVSMILLPTSWMFGG
jgi:hypothetical protein